jgi:hypothetical protein
MNLLKLILDNKAKVHIAVVGNSNIQITVVNDGKIQQRQAAPEIQYAVPEAAYLLIEDMINKNKELPQLCKENRCPKSSFMEGTCDCYNMGLIKD